MLKIKMIIGGVLVSLEGRVGQVEQLKELLLKDSGFVRFDEDDGYILVRDSDISFLEVIGDGSIKNFGKKKQVEDRDGAGSGGEGGGDSAAGDC